MENNSKGNKVKMLKKITIVIFLLVFSFSLVACNKDTNKLSLGEGTGIEKPTTQDKRTDNNQKDTVIANDTVYKLIELEYSKTDSKMKCDIKYPEVSGLSDTDKQEKINLILKEEALKVLKYYEGAEGFLELDINYKVTLSSAKILSIQYSGLGDVDTAAHPNNLFYTTNIDVSTGSRLRLKDIIKIDKDFANKFLNGKFKALWPEQSGQLKHLTKKIMLKRFNEADSLDDIGTEKQSDVFSYFTDDSLGISISASHAIGDHAEFEIKYQELKDDIKTEAEIWKDLVH